MTTNKLPAGRYWIGDPCYMISHDDWSEFLDKLEISNRTDMVQWRGHEVILSNTAHGDGTYGVYRKGLDIGECGVDAGLICIAPEDLVEESAFDLGVFVEFEEEIDWDIGDGTFRFGDVYVYTNEDPYLEDEELESADDEEFDELYDREYDGRVLLM